MVYGGSIMTETINQIEELIVLYAPTVVGIIYTIINWIVVLKKLKGIDVRKEAKDVLDSTNQDIKEVIELNKQLLQQNAELRQKQNSLIEALTKIEVKDDEEQKN